MGYWDCERKRGDWSEGCDSFAPAQAGDSGRVGSHEDSDSSESRSAEGVSSGWSDVHSEQLA